MHDLLEPQNKQSLHLSNMIFTQQTKRERTITNKILAKRVDAICVAYEGMDRYFPKEKIILTNTC